MVFACKKLSITTGSGLVCLEPYSLTEVDNYIYANTHNEQSVPFQKSVKLRLSSIILKPFHEVMTLPTKLTAASQAFFGRQISLCCPCKLLVDL